MTMMKYAATFIIAFGCLFMVLAAVTGICGEPKHGQGAATTQPTQVKYRVYQNEYAVDVVECTTGTQRAMTKTVDGREIEFFGTFRVEKLKAN